MNVWDANRLVQAMVVQILFKIVPFLLEPSQVGAVESFRYREPRYLKACRERADACSDLRSPLIDRAQTLAAATALTSAIVISE